LNEAIDSFEQVIVQEQQKLSVKGGEKKYAEWSYKAMKQLVKLHLRSGNASGESNCTVLVLEECLLVSFIRYLKTIVL
jgi:hypothetical protein